MKEYNLLEIFSGQNQLQKVLDMNQKTQQFGLVLTEQDAKLLVEARGEELRRQQRVEFGESILSKLIFTFCDSEYIFQDNYVETIIRLQEIFYIFKNETMDELTDNELLTFMRKQFENVCHGDLEYLEGTCLSNFARAIRADQSKIWEDFR